jgi:ABC-type multidrug transport system fused ATPase/permease subunit
MSPPIRWLRGLARRLGSQAVRDACAGHGWRLAANALLSAGAAVLESASLILLTALALAATGTAGEQLGTLPGLSPDLGLGTLAGSMAAVIAARLVLQLMATALASRTISEVVAERRGRAIAAYLRASWLSQSETDAGHLQDLTNNFAPRIGQLVGNVIQLINRGLSALIMLAVAIAVSPVAAGAVLALSVAVFLLLAPLRVRIRRLARRGSGVSLVLGRRVAEIAGLIREIRTYAVIEPVRATIQEPIEILKSTQRRAEMALGFAVPMFQAIALAGFTAMLVLAALVFDESAASLGAVVLVAVRSLGYGQAVQANINRVTDLGAWAERFDQSVARFAGVPMRYGGEPLPERPVLAFEEVGFRYPNRDDEALAGVSCRIEAGRAVGVIGPTGSGKTTFVALLLRLVEPTAGRYLIGGQPASRHDAASWGRGFAFVPQAPEILGDTVRENVRFFRPFSDGEVERALRAANLWQEVEAMPQGLDTPIGLAGSNLSGGQRQRLALARALVGAPSVLVLDEPTSALDPLSERAIVDSLAALRGRVTIVTIAHRLSTLSGYDEILVLEDGRLVDAGPPDQLRHRPGFFARSLAAGGPRPG